MFEKAILVLLIIPYLICAKPIELTHKTWRDMLNGEWMVEFYAPWCSACKQFKPIWSDFSDAMSSRNIKIAAVNVEEYPSLSARFSIKFLPTIFHVNDGIFRQYDNERSLRGLKNYILTDEWKKQEPMSSTFAPDSFSMTLMSFVFDLSGFFKNIYSICLNQYGWPTWLIYIVGGLAIISLGIMIGFISLMFFDCIMAIWFKIRDVFGKTKQQAAKSEQETTNDNESTQSDDSNKASDDEENNSDLTDKTEETREHVTTDPTVRQRRLKD